MKDGDVRKKQIKQTIIIKIKDEIIQLGFNPQWVLCGLYANLF